MRNFIVAFMVLILLSSIMFVILRPVSTHSEKKIKSEKSHVEKLLTEPTSYVQQKNNEISDEETEKKEIREPEKIITDMFSEYTQEENSTNTEVPQAIDENDKKALKQITDTAKNDANYQSITNELMEKYGNNPNAEVSDDDVQKFMIKMLQTATPKQ